MNINTDDKLIKVGNDLVLKLADGTSFIIDTSVPKPMTNRDWLNRLDDKKLAQFLTEIGTRCGGWLDWLQAEHVVKDGGTYGA